jgi:hypothetical protein
MHALKAHVRMEVQLQSLFISALDGSGQLHYPAGLPKEKELPVPTSQFGHFREKKTLLLLPETEP